MGTNEDSQHCHLVVPMRRRKKKPGVFNSTFERTKELIENVTVRPTPISNLPIRTSHLLVAEFVFP